MSAKNASSSHQAASPGVAARTRPRSASSAASVTQIPTWTLPSTVLMARRDQNASVSVGGIELQNVEAIVIEQGLTIALLGNSFLSRMDMRREGQTMTLIRRF